jgi:hypothetical protein
VRVARWLAGAAALAALSLLVRQPRPKAGAKLTELEEILRSRNDNDPRLDRDFIGLPAEAKDAFRAAYRALPRERRNERGTIVYLLGKNLTEREDWDFLREVTSEAPCLSLADCANASTAAGQPGDEITLAYPSLVAVRQAARSAEEGASKPEARSVLEAGMASRSRAVARLASSLAAGFGKKSP